MAIDCEPKSRSPSLLSTYTEEAQTTKHPPLPKEFFMTPGKRDRRHPQLSPIDRGSRDSVRSSDSQSCSVLQSASIKVLDTAPIPNFNFRHSCTIRESHGRSIFGVAFNSVNRSRPTDPLLFATVAGHFVTIYQCNLKQDGEDQNHSRSSNSQSVVLLQSFADPAEDEEEFYCCAWSRDTSGNVASSWWTDCCESCQLRPPAHPHQGPLNSTASILPPHQQLVAAAGKRGVIRILCPSLASCPSSLVGHGSAVNELRFHPRDPALLFSFSKDYTVRLWNIASHVLVCVFGGAEGHRAEVLHGDLSLTGDLLLTAGMDHSVKIWRLNTPELANAVIDSFNYRARSNPKPFPTLVQHFPEFSCRDVHGNYVDCARWFGALVISKSCENSVTMWKPGGLEENAPLPSSLPLSGNPGTATTEVGGLRLPSRLQPIDPSANGDFSGHAMPGVPTEHKMSIIHQLRAPDCNLWYIRFDLDLDNQVLALGTGTGLSRIYLWDLKYPESALNLPAQVLHVPTVAGMGAGGVPLSHSAIRQTRFANDGKTLVCVGDNGLIVRFDMA
ncbi:unnamed protein product [Calicophoron daubneyi]|uniref:Polycomb protein EED n=1 Tax=Calicophoron daubneyi TaxID=300641 RepID=A0AAV2TIR1_CALDB